MGLHNSLQILHDSDTDEFYPIDFDKKINLDKTYSSSEITKIKKGSPKTSKTEIYGIFRDYGNYIELIVHGNKPKTKEEYSDTLTEYLNETLQDSKKELSNLKKEYKKSKSIWKLMKDLGFYTEPFEYLIGCGIIVYSIATNQLAGLIGIIPSAAAIAYSKDVYEKYDEKIDTNISDRNHLKDSIDSIGIIQKEIKKDKIGIDIGYLKTN